MDIADLSLPLRADLAVTGDFLVSLSFKGEINICSINEAFLIFYLLMEFSLLMYSFSLLKASSIMQVVLG